LKHFKKILPIALKFLLVASVMTAVTIACMFSADTIVLKRAIFVFIPCYIVFFSSFAYLYRSSRKEEKRYGRSN